MKTCGFQHRLAATAAVALHPVASGSGVVGTGGPFGWALLLAEEIKQHLAQGAQGPQNHMKA